MKQVLLLISLGFLFSQTEVDTTKKLPIFDLSKGFNIPGIIPKNIKISGINFKNFIFFYFLILIQFSASLIHCSIEISCGLELK